MNPIRKVLLKKKEANPFSDNFDKKKAFESIIKELAKDRLFNDESLKMLETLNVAEALHETFKKVFNFLKIHIFRSSISIDDLFNYSIASFNRELLIVSKNISESTSNLDIINLQDYFKHKSESIDPSIGKINTGLALESNLDGVGILLNYARYFKDEEINESESREDIETIGDIFRMQVVSTFYFVLKNEYDRCVWRDGYSSLSGRKIQFSSLNREELLLDNIGFFRMQQYALAFDLKTKALIQNNELLGKRILEQSLLNKRKSHISSIEVNEGYINYELSDGIDAEDTYFDVSNVNFLGAFYSFLENYPLPNFTNLTLYDLNALFDVLQSLLRKAMNIKIVDDSVFAIKDFQKLPYKIKRKALIKYLISRTTYTEVQVSEFIDLVKNESQSRINFWEYPLVEVNDDLLCPILPIVYSNNIVLIDRWLEDGGVDLDTRGKLFEKKIINKLKDALDEKGYDYSIPDKAIFKLEDGSFEEIDFVVNLKHICVFGEVKCIKFPLGPRDEHNALKRLRDGAVQINRKSSFVIKNIDKFKSDIGDIERKEILTIVVTNFPNFSGRIFDNVAIVDYVMLSSYFNSGKLSTFIASKSERDDFLIKVVSEKVHYKSEEDFSKNMKSYFFSPPAIDELRGLFEYTNNKLSFDFMDCDIYSEAIQYKD
ncbi:hypothetical protein SAMN05421823_102723 [Catalinimonas alkaloidigena]|uniref:Nuclease-related domain-containing protein n=1 Tax=Catalinimonas alkaloidigena TaxID=1075417 RepID=A0A1G9BVG7_9BACT|nr:hypothetical protein [Catalinimonas alkaloidigena]SDK43373.1 hypothetical protein SAMN05421823_102723 [Catalinimonas alkaloidigena]